VAAVLFLSEKTVGNHLARIFDKLGRHSRAALAALIGREAGARAVAGSAAMPATIASTSRLDAAARNVSTALTRRV
jgi:hypothetical protein